ncbi:unnamed protein product [Macrosiphum euphorbiae]|uniref:Uncharacterized protein n=1 Tax=Macrosiphum euphorbiae TaxID=13131 RepID=A0AAV0W7B3_9HEMI|nr:unnamed protein product [Macrosiphum euphorbiae]
MFYLAKKTDEESVAQWSARLRDLASKCGFGTELEVVMRDVFVVGMGSGRVQDRLLEEDASSQTVTLVKLVEIATNKEATINASKQWTAGDASINFTRPKEEKTITKQTRGGDNSHVNGKVKCGVCGRANHSTNTCKFKNYTCNACGVKGHLAPMCCSKPNKSKSGYQSKTRNKFLSEEDGDDSSCVNLAYSFFL